MDVKQLVKQWFDKWEEGDFYNLPISEHFKHTSPYGTINGKEEYLNLVEANKDKFLGHRFVLHHEIYADNKACVCYTGIKDDFKLEVSEWYFFKNEQIEEIIAYYNIEGEISEKRKLENF
ncbi:nuclear transport factor 2 family protein [Aquimarina sp. 2201CG5-10]|uniref:nuclear transport factor 2 family protein n=1 Tax=Aquimarina callyspongiae TaxID=3098150 RepID=UPI002AB3C026|nr:nuclear transport factor 2 family protein [Aquimarina sp. 2201CG5-10]MDY8138431.1 nuclear transport factor 2 family protein [Aquimarina sp. 2201CG5-10]